MVTNHHDILVVNPVMPAHACSSALRTLRQEDLKLEVSLGYMGQPCLTDKMEQSKIHIKRLSMAACF